MAVYGPVGAEELYHYGIPRKSGRYPYGSGKEPYQDDPKKRRLNKDESAPKATSKRPETIWSKHRKAQAAKKTAKEQEAKQAAAEKAAEEKLKAEAKKPVSQKAKEMSDEELMRAINRLRLEQTYMSMISATSPQKETVSKGKKFIDKLKTNTKDAADLATNINNLMKGVTGTYANVRAIQKMLNGGEIKLPDDKDRDKKKK